jgi:hypothetical protein
MMELQLEIAKTALPVAAILCRTPAIPSLAIVAPASHHTLPKSIRILLLPLHLTTLILLCENWAFFL